MTDLRRDLSELLVDPTTTGAERPLAGANPYGGSTETDEPVRSDPYAALREDTAAREANEYSLPTISSLSSPRPPSEEAERVVPPEPVLSEAVLVAAGLLEPEADKPAEPVVPFAAAPVPVERVTAVNEVSFADFLSDEPHKEKEEEPAVDLTEIFAGLEPAEASVAIWRRGDDDVIGAGTTPSRSEKRRSLRLRRKAA